MMASLYADFLYYVMNVISLILRFFSTESDSFAGQLRHNG